MPIIPSFRTLFLWLGTALIITTSLLIKYRFMRQHYSSILQREGAILTSTGGSLGWNQFSLSFNSSGRRSTPTLTLVKPPLQLHTGNMSLMTTSLSSEILTLLAILQIYGSLLLRLHLLRSPQPRRSGGAKRSSESGTHASLAWPLKLFQYLHCQQRQSESFQGLDVQYHGVEPS